MKIAKRKTKQILPKIMLNFMVFIMMMIYYLNAKQFIVMQFNVILYNSMQSKVM